MLVPAFAFGDDACAQGARSAVPPRLPTRLVNTIDARATHARLFGPHPARSTKAACARSSGWLPGDCRIVADYSEFYPACRAGVRADESMLERTSSQRTTADGRELQPADSRQQVAEAESTVRLTSCRQSPAACGSLMSCRLVAFLKRAGALAPKTAPCSA